MNPVDVALYLITDSGGMEESLFLQKVELALAAGVTLLQLREKERDSRAFYHLAVKVNEIARQYRVPMLVNDRIDIAMAVDAAGVHIGQQDIPVDAARKLLGPRKLIGATAKTVPLAREAAQQGADYLGVGAIHPTSTKDVPKLLPIASLKEIAGCVDIPVVAIGGLNETNLDVLRGSGAKGIAVVSAIMGKENPSAATRTLKALARDVLSCFQTET